MRARILASTLSICLLTLGALSATVPRVAADANAVVQNDSTWIDSFGFLHIFGEVKNTGDVWLKFVKIVATLRDSDGGIVDVIFAYTRTRFLPPNVTSPFDIIEMETAKSAKVQNYSLIVDQEEATPIQQKLAILNVAESKNIYGWLEIMGEVENQADRVGNYTRIVATFYDETGKVVYTDFTYTNPSDLPAGAKYPFKMTIQSDERSGKVARYNLIAESMNSELTSVPEYPWPMIINVAALTLAVITIRRKRSR